MRGCPQTAAQSFTGNDNRAVLRDWSEDAPCIGLPQHWFFPIEEPCAPAEYAQGVRICNGCEHRERCLSRALKFEKNEPYRYGLWGGLTPQQRAAL